jgi:hypothetical protein
MHIVSGALWRTLRPLIFELKTIEMARARPVSRRSLKHRLPWRSKVGGQCTASWQGSARLEGTACGIERGDKESGGPQAAVVVP